MSTHTFRFRDRDIPFVPGQSVAAALLDAGVRSWRTTRLGKEPRALFCGIGVCYDCLVTADGARGMRACILLARDGLEVSPYSGDKAGSVQ